MKIVIRAGGHGTRLWPLSRRHKPKQFHSILNEKTLLRNTFERVYPLVESTDDIYVSCNEEYAQRLQEMIPEVPSKNFILEPEARNTGPAVALESAYLHAHDVADDEMIVTIPADDHVGNEDAFRQMVQDIDVFLKSHSEYVVAPAVVPMIPSDGYSYLSPGVQIDTVHTYAFTLIGEWLEKPDQTKSRELLRSGKHFAHVGMYMWHLGTAKRLWKHHRPHVWEDVQTVVEAMKENNGPAVHERYNTLPKETIETMLMSHVSEIVMVVDEEMQWSDVGKWQIVKHLLDEDASGNVHRGRVVSHAGAGNLVFGSDDKVIALLGMEDMIVVDTDDALLVCPADKSGEIKELLAKVKDVEDGRHL